MTKNPLLTAIVLLFSLQSFTQSLYPVSLDEKLSHSDLVVEGKVTDQKSFWNAAHTMIYTANTIEVYKIFKGTISPSVIEVMTLGGSVGMQSITASDLLELSPEETGVFFCYGNSLNLRSPATGKLLYDVWGSSQGFLQYDLTTQSANAPFVRMTNIDNDIYNTLQQKTGRAYREIKAFKPGDVKRETKVEAVSVTSFSPATVNAGATIDAANNLLTITGTGFGTNSGSAAVIFDDANDGSGGNTFTVASSNPLIVSWSATSIVVRVPSRAGTGNITVRDNAGLTGTAPTPLTVNYAVLTATLTDGVSTVIKESNLMNSDGNGGYTIAYSTSTAGGGVNINAAPEKATFQRALNTWKEDLGYNVTEGGTTTNQSVTDDGINTIMFDNTNTGTAPLASGVLAVCFSYNSMCTPIATNEIQKTGFDIVIRNAGVSAGTASFTAGPCPPASSAFTDLDLETVILHELGHSLNLAHINDSYQGSFLPNINPGKLMNFSLVNGVRRTSPDNSAYAGATYTINLQGNTYGSCGLFPGEMTPLSATVESKDECPSFPSTPLPLGTVVSYDLVHTTSNKNTDPQYTALNCSATGTGVTNTAFYALKTPTGGGTSLLLTISGYATTPASLASCTPTGAYPAAAGVELALYAVSSCPAGQAFPAPIACRTFNGNGVVSAITVAPNTTYLLVADGIENTKATFNITFGGSALPISLLSFTAEKQGHTSFLKWQTASEYNNDRFEMETSKNGTDFYRIGVVGSHGNSITTESYNFTDILPMNGINYYRLKQVDKDGNFTYSKTVLLTFEEKISPIAIRPNPVTDNLILDLAQPSENVTISIFSADGKLVKKESPGSIQRTKTINVAQLNAGVYILKITTNTGVSQVKFIKS